MTALLAKRHGRTPFIRVVVGTDGIIELIDALVLFDSLLPVVEVVLVSLRPAEVLVVVRRWFVS